MFSEMARPSWLFELRRIQGVTEARGGNDRELRTAAALAVRCRELHERPRPIEQRQDPGTEPTPGMGQQHTGVEVDAIHLMQVGLDQPPMLVDQVRERVAVVFFAAAVLAFDEPREAGEAAFFAAVFLADTLWS